MLPFGNPGRARWASEYFYNTNAVPTKTQPGILGEAVMCIRFVGRTRALGIPALDRNTCRKNPSTVVVPLLAHQRPTPTASQGILREPYDRSDKPDIAPRHDNCATTTDRLGLSYDVHRG